MSGLSILWSMCAGACGTLALTHLFLWVYKPRSAMYVLLAVAALGAAANAVTEMIVLRAQTIAQAAAALKAENVAIYVLLVPLVWFSYLYFGTARRRLALAITGLWSVAVVLNFASPGSLVFREIVELQRHVTWWGEPFTVPAGPATRGLCWRILPASCSWCTSVRPHCGPGAPGNDARPASWAAARRFLL